MRLLAPDAVPLAASARCLWRGHGSERREQAEGRGQLISSNAVRQLRCLSSPLATVVGLGDGDRFHNCSCSPTFPHMYTHMPARSRRALDRPRCLVALKYKMFLGGLFLSVRFCLLFLNPTCCPLQPTSRCLTSILGKSNLQFAGMTISLTISTSSLNLLASDCKQVRPKRVDPPPTEDDSAKQAHSDLGCRQSSAVLNIGKSFSAAELKKKMKLCV